MSSLDQLARLYIDKCMTAELCSTLQQNQSRKRSLVLVLVTTGMREWEVSSAGTPGLAPSHIASLACVCGSKVYKHAHTALAGSFHVAFCVGLTVLENDLTGSSTSGRPASHLPGHHNSLSTGARHLWIGLAELALSLAYH